MARKNDKLTKVAVAVGGALGKADRTAQKAVNAAHIAKAELAAISKQIDALKKQLQKTTKRLKDALE